MEDIDVEKYLKLFTLLTEAQIEEVMVEHTVSNLCAEVKNHVLTNTLFRSNNQNNA